MDGQTANDPSISPGAFKPALSKLVHASDEAAGEAERKNAVAQMGASLKDDAIIQPLLTELTGGFLMLVPITYRADQHRILKLDFVAPFEFSQRGVGGSVRAIPASLGFAPKTLQFRKRPIGWGRGLPLRVRTTRRSPAHQRATGRRAVHPEDREGRMPGQAKDRLRQAPHEPQRLGG
jgi:hypothetical protein